MNPSAVGWIKKALSLFKNSPKNNPSGHQELYMELKYCGFIYGSNVAVLKPFENNKGFTQEERAKVNLVSALLIVYKNNCKKNNFIEDVITFYKSAKFYKSSIIDGIFGKNLEDIIHKRVYIDTNILTKNFNYFITNALLYIDVLAFEEYLKNNTDAFIYLQNLENSIRTVISCALKSKTTKNDYDNSLLKLLDASFRLEKKQLNYRKAVGNIKNHKESQYLLDLAAMACWSDNKIEKKEINFLSKLAKDLQLSPKNAKSAVVEITIFNNQHKEKIALLNAKSIVESFYDNSTSTVTRLIKRNSKRLYQELRESKELVKLLSQSTIRELSEEEQMKMQNQLLDILKSIPSLAIFMLPGGAILLPLFIKFIPKILPSAFDDNRIES